jgi:hypothetical protein
VKCSKKGCRSIFKPQASRMCTKCGVMYCSDCKRHGFTHQPINRSMGSGSRGKENQDEATL